MNDRRAFWAAVATAIIWIAILAISIVFMGLEDVMAPGAAIFTIFMAGIAIGGTAVVWGTASSGPAQDSYEDAGRVTRKAKHLDPDRLARLIESLDEDQMIELETLLAAQSELYEARR